MSLDRSKLYNAFRLIERNLYEKKYAAVQDDMRCKQAERDTICIQTVGLPPDSYSILGVDGSQYYPDRHAGTGDVLVLNVGGVLLSYGLHSSVQFFSEPEVVILDGKSGPGLVLAHSPAAVDLLREARVFEVALRLAIQHQPTVLAFDGSLECTHLSHWRASVQSYFMNRYQQVFRGLDDQSLMYVGYISASMSRECVSALVHGDMTDAEWYASILQKGEYVLTTRGAVYLHTGVEVARIEMPRWISDNALLREEIIAILYAQACKGEGYPVVLGEAHHQAVIRNEDGAYIRAILRTCLQKRIRMSPKQRSKHHLGV